MSRRGHRQLKLPLNWNPTRRRKLKLKHLQDRLPELGSLPGLRRKGGLLLDRNGNIVLMGD